MDRYDASSDHYCYVGSTVLRNKLNIVDHHVLENAETEITNLSIEQVRYSDQSLDLGYLQTIHQTLFQDLYDWAGEIRDISIAKGGTLFCVPQRIVPEINKIFRTLENEQFLIGLSGDEFAAKLAEYYSDFNMIHPFREGNGRVQRIFFEHLAIGNLHTLDWNDINKDDWILANIDGVNVQYDKLTEIFSEIMMPV